MTPGWMMAFPAPSLRELLSAAKLRECTTMNVTAQKFQSSYAPVCKPLAWRNHRTTLPQSASLTAHSGREPGTALPLTQPPGNRKGAGDFHRPYGTQKFLHSTIQRTTLPQSASLTAPSEREPGTAVPFNVPPKNRKVAGDFHRPYERAGSIHRGTH